MIDTNTKIDAFTQRFVEWASKIVVKNQFVSPELDEEILLNTLRGHEQDTAAQLIESQEMELVLMENIKALNEKRNIYVGTLFGEILRAAVDAQLEVLSETESQTKLTDQNLRLVRIFISSIESAMLPDDD